MIAAELQLVLLLIAFYLYECTILVYTNQAIVTKGRKGLWRVSFGSDRWVYQGKELYFLNPLTPFREAHLLSWSMDRPVELTSAQIPGTESLYSHYKILVTICGFGIFLALPCVLFFFPADSNVIGVLAMIYVPLLYISLAVYTERDALHLTKKEALALIGEYFLCPPLALNVVRRISLKQHYKLDLVAFLFGSNIEAASKEESRSTLLQRMDVAIEYSENGAEDRGRLYDRRRQIQGIL